MRIKKGVLYTILHIILIVGLGSCQDEPDLIVDVRNGDIHHYTAKKVSVDLKVLNDSTISALQEADSTQMKLRYILWVFDALNDKKPIKQVYSFSNHFDLNLEWGHYSFLGWVEYVPDSVSKPETDYYFHTDLFDDMLLVNKWTYKGEDPYKMAYRGKVCASIGSNSLDAYNINCEPCMKLIKIIPTDKSEFELGKIKVSYPKGIASSINAMTGEIAWVWEGVKWYSDFKNQSIWDTIFSSTEPFSCCLTSYDSSGQVQAIKDISNVTDSEIKMDIFHSLDKGDIADGTQGKTNISIDTSFSNVTFLEI